MDPEILIQNPLQAGNDSIDDLYALFNEIKQNQLAENSDKNGPLFDKILADYATSTAEPHVKRLAAQLICRLLPDLTISDSQQKAAFSALIDLVEDDDGQTRRQVISGLPRLCSSNCSGKASSSRWTEYTTKVADVLVQLMQTEDQKELSLVQQSLLSVLNADTLSAIDGIFAQLSHPDLPESARQCTIKFLADRLLCVNRAQMTPRVEEAIVDRVTAALDDVTETEFSSFIRILASLQCMQTISGRQRLVGIICAQATDAIDPMERAEFDPSDPVCVARIRACSRLALPFLSKNIYAEKFVAYYLEKVLPQMSKVPDLIDDDRPRLELLQLFADLAYHTGPNFKASDSQLTNLLTCIESELPQQQQQRAQASITAEYNFSNMECLLLALYELGRTRMDYFAQRSAEMEVLRKRLQNCQIASQSYQKSLKKTSAAATLSDSGSAATASVAIATVSNVIQLCGGLLCDPPQLTSDASASWRAGSKRKVSLAPNRHFDGALTSGTSTAAGLDAASRKRRQRDIVDLPTYRPPAGKFSANVGAMPRGPQNSVQGGRSRYYNVYTGSAAKP